MQVIAITAYSFPLLTGHLTVCDNTDLHKICNVHIRIIRAFFHIKQKNCAILAIKQLPYNPKSKNFKETGYFEEVFPWNSDKTCQFVCADFLTSRPLIKEPGNVHIRIIRAFFHIKQKNCAILAIKQLPYNPKSKNFKEIGYFEEVFPWNSDKTCQFVCDDFLTSRPLIKEPGN